MRFWSKTKHGEKKLSREKQASRSESGETHGKKKKPTHTELSFTFECRCIGTHACM